MTEETPITRGQRLKARAVAAFLATARTLPGWLMYLVADLLTPILVLVTRLRERKIGPLGRGLLRNQRTIFRDQLTPHLSRKLVWGWARHMTHMVVDFARMPLLTRSTLASRMDLRDLEKVRALHAEGHGVICASGHLGVFELCGHVIAVSGMPALAVSKPSKNPALAEVLNRVRTSEGQRIIYKQGVLWPLRKALSRGEVIGLAGDENDKRSPCFVPYLGTLAATNTTTALLQRRTGSPIAVISCHRESRGRFRFRVWDVIRNPRSHDRDADLESITRQIMAALSRGIRTYPEQWLWGSRRFETRPTGEVPGPDGLPPEATTAAPVLSEA